MNRLQRTAMHQAAICVRLSGLAASVLPLFAVSAVAQDLPAPYESLTACEKENFIWNDLIVPSTYAELPPLEGLDVFAFNRTDMKVTVQRISDEMPEGRIKHIHKRGAVAAVQFEADPQSPFTGLFQGARCGLIRAGLAVAPGGLSPVVPGAALKLFVDGRPSANLLFMPSLDGQGSNYNFFAFPFNTSIAEPKNIVLKLLKTIFARASSTPTSLSLNLASKYTENGDKVGDALAPEIAVFEPTREVQFSESPHDVRLDLLGLPVGTVLFHVFEKKSDGSRGIRMGQVVTKTPFVASEWGDDRIFFRHQRLEDQSEE